MTLLDLGQECLQKPYCDVICAVIVISVARKFTLRLKVSDHAIRFADHLYLRILNCT